MSRHHLCTNPKCENGMIDDWHPHNGAHWVECPMCKQLSGTPPIVLTASHQPPKVMCMKNPNPRRFYISGPMRGLPNFNFPAFDRAAIEGRKRGFRVMSPADMDRELGHTETDDLATINTPANQRKFAGRDCAALLSLEAENGDGIALLPGWQPSTGAMAELMLARWLKLCVVDATTWEPFTQEALDKLNLSAILANTRLYLGDANCGLYYESIEEGK